MTSPGWCSVHEATEAVDEQLGVCWEYDGGEDCVIERPRRESMTNRGLSVRQYWGAKCDEPGIVGAEKVWLVYEYIGGGGGQVVLWEEPDPAVYPDAEAYWLIPQGAGEVMPSRNIGGFVGLQGSVAMDETGPGVDYLVVALDKKKTKQ